MNRFLDDATKKSISDKMLRFDDREIRGKTIMASTYGTVTGASFTDGTWCAVCAKQDYDGPDLGHVDRMELYDLRDLGLITEEQYHVARLREDEAQRQRKLDQIRKLQAEVDSRGVS